MAAFANSEGYRNTSGAIESALNHEKILIRRTSYVDLMVMQRSCSSFLVSVALVSPALEAAMIPAWEGRGVEEGSVWTFRVLVKEPF